MANETKISCLPIPTIQIRVDPTHKYEDLVTIQEIVPKFSMVGGINLPKKIQLIGSDGKSYSQLVKGNDDLRQDAILEQVFEMVQLLLDRNKISRANRLRIKTYKVLPLTGKSGVLQWVENSMPMGDWLFKAHSLYGRSDWPSDKCRKMLHEVMSSSKPTKLRTFKQILQNFHPVFRYFFFSQLCGVTANEVWELRCQYVRSVAVSSILGYILGIGDRHSKNILLDTKTAEVIHIDLGVAFNQGEVLSVPEKVPFRLTQDVIDGMGVCGTEGLFRKTCENTLSLMKEEKEVIMMVLNVLRFDPLYSWTISSIRRRKNLESEIIGTGSLRKTKIRNIGSQKSNNDLENQNLQANRALNRVQSRISHEKQTIKNICNNLIEEATDASNLSQMFSGWSPWL